MYVKPLRLSETHDITGKLYLACVLVSFNSFSTSSGALLAPHAGHLQPDAGNVLQVVYHTLET